MYCAHCILQTAGEQLVELVGAANTSSTSTQSVAVDTAGVNSSKKKKKKRKKVSIDQSVQGKCLCDLQLNIVSSFIIPTAYIIFFKSICRSRW